MRIADIAGVNRWLSEHPLNTDRLWQREALAVSEGEIQLFYARAAQLGLRQNAIDAIDALQAALIVAVVNGDLPEAPAALIMHETPMSPFFVDELVESLVKLRPARRQACLFALETHNEASVAINLTWGQAGLLRQLSPLCREILHVAGRTRHLKLPYVFWEWSTTTIATPLLELQWSVEKAFACTWPELAQRYRRMIRVNRSADAASLLQLANQQ